MTATYPGVFEVHRRPDVPGEHCLALVRRRSTYVVLHYHPEGQGGDADDCPDVYRALTVEEARSTWLALRGRIAAKGFRRARR